jgi:hypothetical protein
VWVSNDSTIVHRRLSHIVHQPTTWRQGVLNKLGERTRGYWQTVSVLFHSVCTTTGGYHIRRKLAGKQRSARYSKPTYQQAPLDRNTVICMRQEAVRVIAHGCFNVLRPAHYSSLNDRLLSPIGFAASQSVRFITWTPKVCQLSTSSNKCVKTTLPQSSSSAIAAALISAEIVSVASSIKITS